MDRVALILSLAQFVTGFLLGRRVVVPHDLDAGGDLLAESFKLGFRRGALGFGIGLLSFRLRLLAERLLAAVALPPWTPA